MEVLSKSLFLILFTTLFVTNSIAQKSDWAGIYTFDEESWDENRVRTSTWFRLQIKDEKGRFSAIYSAGENGKIFIKWQFNVKTQGNKASFYFDETLTAKTGESRPISETLPAKGDLLFELEKSTKNDKPIIYTIWKKLNLAVRTESGSYYGKNIFFRKV